MPLSQTGAELLFEVFSQRYERGSTIVTSNLLFDEWTSVFGSERLTGALLDRLTHHVHILESKVEDGRGGLGPIGQHPVSRPRSSNRTCRFPASGSPIDFTAKLSVLIHSRRVPFATPISPNTTSRENRRLPRVPTLCRLARKFRIRS